MKASTDARTVVIVEDDEGARDVFRTFLEYNGYRVLEASDGVEGLSLIREHVPDVVLLDLTLPGMDGKMVAALLRLDARTAVVRLIIVTASADEDTRRWAIHFGCDGFIEKPVDLRALKTAVDRCLQ
jgi:CheY-like chemotaxis protein